MFDDLGLWIVDSFAKRTVGNKAWKLWTRSYSSVTSYKENRSAPLQYRPEL
jgi:hypothetical protein